MFYTRSKTSKQGDKDRCEVDENLPREHDNSLWQSWGDNSADYPSLGHSHLGAATGGI